MIEPMVAGISLEVPTTAGGWIIYAAAVITAAGVVWRQLILPAFRRIRGFIRKINESIDVLQRIWTEFEVSNGHSGDWLTLRGRIDLIERIVKEESEYMSGPNGWRHRVANTLMTLVGRAPLYPGEGDVAGLEPMRHQRRHDDPQP